MKKDKYDKYDTIRYVFLIPVNSYTRTYTCHSEHKQSLMCTASLVRVRSFQYLNSGTCEIIPVSKLWCV